MQWPASPDNRPLRSRNEWEANKGMIVYRVLSFLMIGLCGLLFGVCVGLVPGVLIFGSTKSFFWLLSREETMLMTIGVAVGGGLGISIGRRWTRCR